ncbi:MAG: hypothetical protein KDG89_12735 [Geminicoccaceae bacterium]|nr:hypothetical protein [Geminicoccaceae bacterium]
MRQAALPTALAAFASALLFLSAMTGAAGLPVVAYFVQLPLFYLGFGFGLGQAALASTGALVLVALAGGGLLGLVFAVVELAPCLFALRQSLLYRRVGERPEDIEWYPAGRVLAALTLMALGGVLVGLLVLASRGDGLVPVFDAAIETVATALPTGGGPGLVAVLTALAPLIAGIVGASWLLMTVVNALLGFWLARRGGGTRRGPLMPLALHLPRWCGGAALAAAAASVVAGGDLAFFAQSALVVLALPFFLQGLAVVHVLVRRLPQPRVALVVFYLALLLLSWPLALALAALGLAEEWAGLRRRFT